MHCGDTSFFVDFFDPERPHHQDAADWYDAHSDQPLFAPAVVYWELYRGAVRVGESYLAQVQRFMEDVAPIDLTAAEALEAAHVEHETRTDGNQLAIVDCLIAGIVRSVGGMLVTRDRDFERVRGLACEYYADRP